MCFWNKYFRCAILHKMYDWEKWRHTSGNKRGQTDPVKVIRYFSYILRSPPCPWLPLTPLRLIYELGPVGAVGRLSTSTMWSLLDTACKVSMKHTHFCPSLSFNTLSISPLSDLYDCFWNKNIYCVVFKLIVEPYFVKFSKKISSIFTGVFQDYNLGNIC